MERQIYTEILGNRADRGWRERIAGCAIDTLELDGWSGQKSRFTARTLQGREVAVALKRPLRLHDGDILHYDPEQGEVLLVRLRAGELLTIGLEGLYARPPREQRECLFELGHAIGNQHWPAVMHNNRIYVPLTVDRKVMQRVVESHHFEGLTLSFEAGEEVIPYLSPHECRHLFARCEGEEHPHHHPHHHPHPHHEEP